ncbi:ASCH domain-containing protein [Bacteroides fragilis]
MKTLTDKQPWASLIVSGLKDIENRTWRTNFRGRVLIHASAKSISIRNPSSVFTSKQWDSLSESEKMHIISGKAPTSAIIGSVEIVDCVQNHPSVWAEQGVYNWVLANPIQFDKPIEGVKGKLSFWDYDLPEEPKHAPKYMRSHLAMNLDGLLRNYGKRNMKGVFLDDNGRELSDKECRKYIAECQAKGWKVIPMCGEKACPDFDHFGKGCPGHRITKEDYERDLTK